MATPIATPSRDPEVVARLAALCIEVRDFLRGARQSINDEIDVYPKPIPRCDAQFNFLYEQRSHLVGVMARFDEDADLRHSPSGVTDRLAEFAASAPVTDDPRERTLRERIALELATMNPQ